jgi:hypothetical protein
MASSGAGRPAGASVCSRGQARCDDGLGDQRLAGVVVAALTDVPFGDRAARRRPDRQILPVALKTEGVTFDAFVAHLGLDNNYPLEALTVPTLIVHAKDDPLVSCAAAQRAAHVNALGGCRPRHRCSLATRSRVPQLCRQPRAAKNATAPGRSRGTPGQMQRSPPAGRPTCPARPARTAATAAASRPVPTPPPCHAGVHQDQRDATRPIHRGQAHRARPRLGHQAIGQHRNPRRAPAATLAAPPSPTALCTTPGQRAGTNGRILAQPGRAVVRAAHRPAAAPRRPHLTAGARTRRPRLDQDLERQPPALHLDQDRRRNP